MMLQETNGLREVLCGADPTQICNISERLGELYIRLHPHHEIHTSLSFFCAMSLLSLNTRYRAAAVMRAPWPRSPNMTANRKGKVMMVYGAGDKEADERPWRQTWKNERNSTNGGGMMPFQRVIHF